MGWRLVLGISLTAECRALRKLGEAVVLWLGRMIQVLGAGKWLLLGCFCPFSPLVHSWWKQHVMAWGPQTQCSISPVSG